MWFFGAGLMARSPHIELVFFLVLLQVSHGCFSIFIVVEQEHILELICTSKNKEKNNANI